jgi:hypothetical protein
MDFLRRIFRSQVTPAAAGSGGPQRVQVPIFDARPGTRVEVVGESHYQDALARAAGGRTEDGPARVAQIAGLIAEPSNPYDSNAVMVQINGAVVGYLTRPDAIAYQPVIREVMAQGYPGFGCHASLTGGWDRGGGDRGSIGVALHLGTPRELLVELGIAAPVPVEEPAPRPEIAVVYVDPDSLGLLHGRSVCFTGDSGCTIGGALISRATQEALAINAGLVVVPRVTKKLDLLVVSPLAGTTGKVEKAVEYGIACVEEAGFWRAVGVRID